MPIGNSKYDPYFFSNYDPFFKEKKKNESINEEKINNNKVKL
jgi:hypothetical protein